MSFLQRRAGHPAGLGSDRSEHGFYPVTSMSVSSEVEHQTENLAVAGSTPVPLVG